MMTNMTLFLLTLLSVIVTSIGANSIQVNAPVVTDNLYDESVPMLYASLLAYDFGKIVNAARKAEIKLKVPDGSNIILKRFETKSVDFRYLNDGNGLAFHEMMDIISLNMDEISKLYEEDEDRRLFLSEIITHLEKFHSMDHSKHIYLATYRSIQAKVSCVYGVIKDTYNKRIIISFRGSQNPDFSTHDWRSNLDAALSSMKTPALIRDEMEGVLKERILVHQGFYEYLFDNKKIAGEQRYDRIVDDIRSPIMEEGYSIYVTGHSLGAALSQLFSFELAGEGVNSDWVPKPITCISYAAPRSGTSGYRTAVEQEEKDGLIRMLRIVNEEDIVPALPPWSLGWKRRVMKHVGINLRLTNDTYTIVHTTGLGLGVWNAVQNSIFKPVLKALHWHSLKLHEVRMIRNSSDLSAIMIDDLYKDKTVVSEDFIKSKTTQSNENDEL